MRRRRSSACLLKGTGPTAAGVAVAEKTTGAVKIGPVPDRDCLLDLAHHLCSHKTSLWR